MSDDPNNPEPRAPAKAIVHGQLRVTLADIGMSGLDAVNAATARAMTSAAVYFDDLDERKDWDRLPAELATLDITHLRMLSELKDPVIPKLRMLTSWQPQVMSDQVVKLAATSVLNERLAARERSHGRTLQWIVAIGTLVGAIAGFLLAKLS